MGVEDHDFVTPPHDAEDGGTARTALVESLFRQHNEALIRFLQARLRSRNAAREVAQEAYVRLLRLDRPSGASSYFQSLLFRTAANLATDRLRRDQKQLAAADAPLFNEWTDVRTPERQVSGVETMQRLERLVAALPSKCREAFVLNRVEGMGFAEIAELMNLSERMVRIYVMRAVLHCRARVDFEESRG